MPVIFFYGPVMAMDKEKKKELVRSLTDSASKVTGIPASEFTIMLRASATDQVGIGGELLCDRAPKK